YKQRDCAKVHIHFELHHLPEDTSQQTLIHKIEELNTRQDIHAILVQMPLPEHINSQEVVDSITPHKDVDGLTPLNLGNIFINREAVTPCTPAGIIKLIEATDVPIQGKHVVCVGRSHLVGKPIGIMLLNRNATVTYCHSKTKNLAAVTKKADILVAAVGKPEFITAEMVKKNATVIDVGINNVNGKLVGDVKFDEVKAIAGYITPVPGGVGPLTRAMLLENTLKLAINNNSTL
ncbi:bifunctional methylenetetrahydrofolate dehydrogenase/methenyltetrahydrofolate cyclohydrolase, partial [Candidatus Poribacteria bacterium]|nr:bifunctional methylenetetrahydrofolate dehydrogenase/methenyltetrahydrofolate cyclohydrolase [Candidatus Poribacteria bacterium]